MPLNNYSRFIVHSLLLMTGALGACSGGGGSQRPTDQAGQPVDSTERATQRSTQRSIQRGTAQPVRSRRALGAAAVETLLELSADLNPQVRANALEALQGHTGSLESVVALGLSDPIAPVRSVAAMVAGNERLHELLPMLKELIQDPSPFVRASGLYAVSKIEGASTRVDLTPLSVMLLESEDIRVSSNAAYVLGELGNPSAVPLLQQAGSRQWGQTSLILRQMFRLQIAEAMIKLGDMDSMDAVRSALYPSRPEELEATALAVQIIGEVQDRGAIDQLIYLVDEDSQRPMPAEVRLAVAGSLAKLGLSEGGFIADEYAQNQNPVIRAQAAAVYGRTGRAEHLAKLESMLLDESPQVRASSAGAILEILG